MARMLPDVELDAIRHDSERLVYAALKSLSDEHVVLHSFPWLRPRRDLASEPLREGEVDFIVLHPERGMLIVEVKGGRPELRDRKWFRGESEIRDPFDQARRSKYALLDEIERRSRQSIGRTSFSHGEVVIFPHCEYDGETPLNMDPRTLLDSRSLADMPARIEDAFDAWDRWPCTLSERQFKQLLDILMPKLRLMRTLSSVLAEESLGIVQMTRAQQATLAGLLANDRVLVEGAAGSGKTLLAFELALRLVADGKRVLLLMFNRHLAEWLKERADEEPLVADRGTLEISTFHSLCLALGKRAGVEFSVPNQSDPDFWDAEAPLIAEQALAVMRGDPASPSFDAVIVDEGQDFLPDWWITIEGVTSGGREGRLYAFLDLKQSLRPQASLPPLPFSTRLPLVTNCRSTRALARSAASLAQLEVFSLPGAPEGAPPELIHLRKDPRRLDALVAQVRQLIKSDLQPRQIVLIGAAPLRSGPLRGMTSLAGVPLTSDASRWRKGEGLLVTTARAFKGLEADVVVIHSVSDFSPAFRPVDLYVAWTRARHRLVVVAADGELRNTALKAIAEATET